MKMILFIAMLWSTGPLCNMQNENNVIANDNNDNSENTGDKGALRPPIPPIPPILNPNN